MLSTGLMTVAASTVGPAEDELLVVDGSGAADSVKSFPEPSCVITDGLGFESDSAAPVFELEPTFLAAYATRKADFGLDGLGEIVYRRTYSRQKEDGTNESWFETVARVINGTFRMQQRWFTERSLGWDPVKAQKSAQIMYSKMFEFKFLPAGRGLWAMGSPLTNQRNLMASLNSCAFVSTEEMWSKVTNNPAKPFMFLADVSMLGIGCGFDEAGARLVEESTATFSSIVQRPCTPAMTFKIPDTREGWVESIGLLINSYLHPAKRHFVVFDYAEIRKAGTPIKSFGGIASGPQPLIDLHTAIRTTLNRNLGTQLSVTSIVDLMNHIGKCIVSGNVRRTAEIAIGRPSSEFLDLKNYSKNGHRMEYGWVSNNSVYSTLGGSYTEIAERIRINGEPGVIWLDNHRAYGRMGDPPTYKDSRVAGVNPCAEQSLEPYECCNLVEVFLPRIGTLDEFIETLKYAFLYAKTVSLGQTHIVETNRVLLRNRRIGTSLSGIAQFVEVAGIHQLREWCQNGYRFINEFDGRISDIFAIPRSIKMTTVKPSGTISLLAGSTPGMHWAESRFCLRRVRIAKTSKLIQPLEKAGYDIEECVGDASTLVVSFPIDYGPVRSLDSVSMFEQLNMASLLQELWSDNSVSCTITFDPKTEGPQIESALRFYQYKLKAASFLPRCEAGVFAQMPFESITEQEYRYMKACVDEELLQELLRKDSKLGTDGKEELFCDAEKCVKL